MHRIIITIVVVCFAYLGSPKTWAGEFDGKWEVNVEVENENGWITKHKAKIMINNNSFDSRVFDRKNFYSMIKGKISPNGIILNGYFMWGDESDSIPIKQGRFKQTTATLNGSKGLAYLTVKFTRVTNAYSKEEYLDEVSNSRVTMERPKMIVGDTWTSM